MVEFSMNCDDFVKEFDRKFQDICEFDLLVISNVPSILKSLELISQNWFKIKVLCHKNLIGITLRIDEEINESFGEHPRIFEFNFKETLIITFQSTIGDHGSKTFWKIPGREKFYSLYIDDDEDEEVVDFFQEFLVEEFKDGNSGIIAAFANKDEIRLHELGMESSSNLLMIAALWNRPQVVQKLLTREFDIDYENIYGKKAIDKAWERFKEPEEDTKDIADEIILCLLNANSIHPMEFNCDDASENIQNFVAFCENLHQNVDNNDFDAIEAKLKEHPNLIHFYNRENKSLLLHALETAKFKIIDFLHHGISKGAHEELSFLENYKELYKRKLENLRDQHKLNAKELPKTHLLVLRSKTKIGSNDQLHQFRWKCVGEAYETLDKNEFCSKLLKVAAHVKSVYIFFDFKHDTVYYLDPTRSITTLGTSYLNGTIYIGAKKLVDGSNKAEVLSVLAHEMCHLAVLVTYINPNFDPFPMGESKEKKRYVEKVMVQCRERQGLEPIVSNAFGYETHLQESELIVTVAQVLMHYYDNPEKIRNLRDIFIELFNYAKEVVEPELEKALLVLKILQNHHQSINFEKLTEPMKAKILHSKINFQGEETSFYKIIGNDYDTLRLLKPENIYEMLTKNTTLEISKGCVQEVKHGIIEREYISIKKYEEIRKNERNNKEALAKKQTIQANKKSFNTIRTEAEKSKVFLLADHAGTGKTTSFEDAAIKLKNSNKNSWVYFINLRKHVKIFEQFKKKNAINFGVVDVLQFLLKCVDQSTRIELNIFVQLFLQGKLILLFDGVDEISPKYTDLLEKVLTFLKASGTKNQLWVSTRPHYVENLEKILDCSAFQFAPYTNEGKKKLIGEILKSKKMSNDKDQKRITHEIEKYISQLEIGLISTQQIDNSLMLKIISELFAEGAIDISVKGDYGIYDAMYEKQQQDTDDKISFADRKPYEDFPISKVHQVLALKIIIEDDYLQMLNFNLDDLVIMKKWNRVKKKFTCDIIQRYGFVNVDLQDVDNKSSINFIHRTHGEFFVAMFLIKSLFDDNVEDSDEEIVRKYEILNIIINHGVGDFIKVREFVFSYMKYEAREKVFHEKIISLIDQKILQIHGSLDLDNVNAVSSFGSYAKLLCTDQDLLKKLWKIDNKNNVLKQFIYKKFIINYISITSFAESSFGSNWHEMFNKSGKKLISDEGIESFHEGNIINWLWNRLKNLLKFCDFVDKNYTKEEKLTFYRNVDLARVGVTKIRWEIIPRLRENADGIQFITECVAEICERTISIDSITYVINQFEQASNINKDLIRKHLQKYIPIILSNTYDSDTQGIFKKFEKLLMMYYTRQEIQDILVKSNEISFFEGAELLFYSEYKQFIQCIYGPSNYHKIATKIKENVQEHTVLIREREQEQRRQQEVYGNAVDFVHLVFSNDERKKNYVLRRIIKDDSSPLGQLGILSRIQKNMLTKDSM